MLQKAIKDIMSIYGRYGYSVEFVKGEANVFVVCNNKGNRIGCYLNEEKKEFSIENIFVLKDAIRKQFIFLFDLGYQEIEYKF